MIMRPNENEFRQVGMKFEMQVELPLNEVNGGRYLLKSSSSLSPKVAEWFALRFSVHCVSENLGSLKRKW
jgi:hypothetical protein